MTKVLTTFFVIIGCFCIAATMQNTIAQLAVMLFAASYYIQIGLRQ